MNIELIKKQLKDLDVILLQTENVGDVYCASMKVKDILDKNLEKGEIKYIKMSSIFPSKCFCNPNKFIKMVGSKEYVVDIDEIKYYKDKLPIFDGEFNYFDPDDKHFLKEDKRYEKKLDKKVYYGMFQMDYFEKLFSMCNKIIIKEIIE